MVTLYEDNGSGVFLVHDGKIYDPIANGYEGQFINHALTLLFDGDLPCESWPFNEEDFRVGQVDGLRYLGECTDQTITLELGKMGYTARKYIGADVGEGDFEPERFPTWKAAELLGMTTANLYVWLGRYPQYKPPGMAQRHYWWTKAEIDIVRRARLVMSGQYEAAVTAACAELNAAVFVGELADASDDSRSDLWPAAGERMRQVAEAAGFTEVAKNYEYSDDPRTGLITSVWYRDGIYVNAWFGGDGTIAIGFDEQARDTANIELLIVLDNDSRLYRQWRGMCDKEPFGEDSLEWKRAFAAIADDAPAEDGYEEAEEFVEGWLAKNVSDAFPPMCRNFVHWCVMRITKSISEEQS